MPILERIKFVLKNIFLDFIFWQFKGIPESIRKSHSFQFSGKLLASPPFGITKNETYGVAIFI